MNLSIVEKGYYVKGSNLNDLLKTKEKHPFQGKRGDTRSLNRVMSEQELMNNYSQQMPKLGRTRSEIFNIHKAESKIICDLQSEKEKGRLKCPLFITGSRGMASFRHTKRMEATSSNSKLE